MKKILILVSFNLFLLFGLTAQWGTNGNVVTPVNFLGSTNDVDLTLKRNGLNRMQFQNLQTWNGLNGATASNVSRILLGLNDDMYIAWSMLHLRDGDLDVSMQRDWFNIGTSYTGNIDFMYTGLLERPTATGPTRATDAVIAWGCDATTYGPDNLRFLFLNSPPTLGAPVNASQTEQGLEVFRISPMGNCGIGDFSNNGFGLNEQPTQRLDIDGNVRVRQMNDLEADVIITGVEQNEEGDYLFNYLSFNGSNTQFLNGAGDWVNISSSGADCDWAVNPDGDVVTGVVVPGQWGCAALENVGIGVQDPDTYKLMVDAGNSTSLYGGADMRFSRQNAGVVLNVEKINGGGGISVICDGGTSTTNVGLRVNVGTDGPTQTMYGVNSRATNNGSYVTFGDSYGVYGYACDARNNYAIYGQSCSSNGDHYAGYFAGVVVSTGGFSGSDIMLKQDIEELTGALDILSEIECKTYHFRQDEFPQLSLPSGEHCGVIAQDLEEIMPNLVRDIHHPDEYNEDGELISEGFDYKGVNYQELIPVVIEATKEQQEIIDEQSQKIEEYEQTLEDQNEKIELLDEKLEELSELILECCSLMDDKSMDPRQNDIQIEELKVNSLDQNIPNPFSIKTKISYSLGNDGNVKIVIYDSTGQVVDVLVESYQMSGNHNVTWSDNSIARGVYFYSLEINGEELVRRMVKL